MKSEGTRWVRECPCEITVCDAQGILVEMNLAAEAIFETDGGSVLLGTDILACHPEPDRSKLAGMLQNPARNVYFSTENGEKRFFYQAPWTRDGRFAGYVEISFEVPGEIPHFVRE